MTKVLKKFSLTLILCTISYGTGVIDTETFEYVSMILSSGLT